MEALELSDPEAELEMDEEAWLAQVRAADVAAGLPACRVCGCTENAGCDPPCWWIEPDLCSNCAGVALSITSQQGQGRGR